MSHVEPQSPQKPYRFIGALAGLALVSVGLLIIRMVLSDSTRFGFLPWNLFLAAVPALLAWWLSVRIRRNGWLQWSQVLLTASWIAFLPNSFYLITDLIHLRPNYEADLLFDITLLTSFVMMGIALGYLSLYLIHQEMLKRMREYKAYALVGVVLLAACFAICLGRYTRWNTWDIILQPAGLLFDVSDRVINPNAHLQTYETTFIMFAVLFAGYGVIYEAARYLRNR